VKDEPKLRKIYDAIENATRNSPGVPAVGEGPIEGDPAVRRVLRRLGIQKNASNAIDEIAAASGKDRAEVSARLAAYTSESGGVCATEPKCAECALSAECEYRNRRPRLKDLPEEERPRERLCSAGAPALKDSELLAILLRTGTARETAIDLAQRLLTQFGDFRALGNATVSELRKIKGIGPAKAAEIKAAMEIARRYRSLSAGERPRFSAPEAVFARFHEKMRDVKVEQVWVLMLDKKNRLIRESMVSQGSLDGSLVHQREAFKDAMRESASAVIFVHNHPSGDPAPSEDDRELTRRLVQTGEIVGIKVLDHVIIGENDYVSLADRGLI
jgi:DNA repair protein RadC